MTGIDDELPGLRARIRDALATTPAAFVRDDPEAAAHHATRPWTRHDQHHYYWSCALCLGEIDTLTDAVMAAIEDQAATAPTLEQLHAYLLAHDWQRLPDGRNGYERWQHPTRDYEDDAMAFPPNVLELDEIWLNGMIETFASKEGRCEHEVLADMLGRPDPATLLKRIAGLEADLTTLAAVGDLYLRCLDDDPANEYLTLGAAIRVTDIREAVERQGYDVRWQTDEQAAAGYEAT